VTVGPEPVVEVNLVQIGRYDLIFQFVPFCTGMVRFQPATIAIQRLQSKAQRRPKRIFKDANDLGTNDTKRPRLELSPPEPKDVIASEGDCAPELRVVSCPPLLPRAQGEHVGAVGS
jgi:hypothetical protein